MISAKSVLSSINLDGIRLDTLELNMPTFLLAQFNTHRVFSRSASSHRAIPTSKLMSHVEENPFIPYFWGKAQPGMRAREEIDDELKSLAKTIWLECRKNVISAVEELVKIGVAKEVANRLLAPFSWTRVVVTATDWDNYLTLRTHPDAQEEHRILALEIKKALENAEPRLLSKPTHFHLPYVGHVLDMDRNFIIQSIARCARVSYLNHFGTPSTLEEDKKLYEKLITSDPKHFSPAEHQACPSEVPNTRYANLNGWKSIRYMMERGFEL